MGHVYVAATSSYTGGFGDQLQQVLFVPENELENADKTRVVLILFIPCPTGFIEIWLAWNRFYTSTT